MCCEKYKDEAISGQKNVFMPNGKAEPHGKSEPRNRWFQKSDFKKHNFNTGHVSALKKWDRDHGQALGASAASPSIDIAVQLGASPSMTGTLMLGDATPGGAAAGAMATPAVPSAASMECTFVMRATMWLAREQVALKKLPSLVQLLRDSGAAVSTGYGNYVNEKAAEAMVSFAATEIRAAQMLEIRGSRFVSWAADGTTDSSISHFLIVYVFWLCGGVLKSGFLRLMECGGDAVSIYNAVCRALGSLRGRVVAAATDGASVMLGVSVNGMYDTTKSGDNVCAYFAQRFPYFSAMHCVAHVSALLGEAAAAQVELLLFCCEGVQMVYSFLSTSYKRRALHRDIQETIGEPVRKAKPIHVVRWLSRAGAFTQASLMIVSDILLIMNLAKDETPSVAAKPGSATSVLPTVCSLGFLLGVPCLAAVLTLHSRFNQSFQGKIPICEFGLLRTRFLNKLQRILDISFADIGSFDIGALGKGIKLQSMLDNCMWCRSHVEYKTTAMAECISIPAEAGRSILVTKERSLKMIYNGIRDYARLLKIETIQRWPITEVTLWGAFSVVMNLMAFTPDSGDADTYGTAEIETLADQYGAEHTVTKDGHDEYHLGEEINVPRPIKFADGAAVKAKWDGELSNTGTWFDAKITAVNKDGTYRLLYSDNEVDNEVNECDMKPIVLGSLLPASKFRLSKKPVPATVVAIDIMHDDPILRSSHRLYNSLRVQTIVKLAGARQRANNKRIHDSEVAHQKLVQEAREHFRAPPVAPSLELLVVDKAVKGTIVVQYEDESKVVIDLDDDLLTTVTLGMIQRIETIVVPPVVDAETLKIEWPDAKVFMCGLRAGRTDLKQCWAAVINSRGMLSVFPNVLTIFQLGLVIPTNSTMCESGISVVNEGKNKRQGQLGCAKLEARTMVAVSGSSQGNERARFPSLADMDVEGLAGRFLDNGGVARRSVACKRSHDASAADLSAADLSQLPAVAD